MEGELGGCVGYRQMCLPDNLTRVGGGPCTLRQVGGGKTSPTRCGLVPQLGEVGVTPRPEELDLFMCAACRPCTGMRAEAPTPASVGRVSRGELGSWEWAEWGGIS